MIRYIRCLVLTLAAGVFSLPAMAQQSGPSAPNLRDKIELSRSTIETKRAEVLREGLQMTPEQSEAFWPVYREYQADVGKLGDQRARLLQTYMLNYESMSEKQADDLLSEWFKLRSQHVEIQRKFKDKFRKVLPAPKVVRLYQMEVLMDAVVTGNLQAQLPLAGEEKPQN